MMHKSLKIMLALVISLFTLPMMGSAVFADSYDIADGDYDINISALEANADEESVAGGFIDSTANLSVKGENITLTLGIAKSGEGEGELGDFDFDIEWVKVDGKEPIAEEDGGTVTYYTYELDSVETILPAQLRYVVPGFPGLEDGHEPEFRLQLNGLDDLPQKEEDEGEGSSGGESDDNDGNDQQDNGDNGNGTVEDNNGSDNGDNGNGTVEGNNNGSDDGTDKEVTNPKTGDSSNIGLYALLLISASIPLVIQFKKRFNA